MPSYFALGPSISNVLETTPVPPPPPGRRTIAVDDPAWAPGGRVFLKLNDKVNPADIDATNVYAFYVPEDQAPTGADLTYQWFFKNAPLNASVHAGTADANGKLAITVPGVTPSLTPYRVQIVIEYPS